jgi:hypothetical protein
VEFDGLPPHTLGSQPLRADYRQGAAVRYGQRVYTCDQVTHARNLVFDWDDANMAHIARHSVTTSEAEDVIRGDRFPLGPRSEARSVGRRNLE